MCSIYGPPARQDLPRAALAGTGANVFSVKGAERTGVGESGAPYANCSAAAEAAPHWSLTKWTPLAPRR